MDAMTRLQEAFTTGLDLDPGAVDWPTLTYRGIPEWDSVAHMQVVAEIEDAFDIMLETDDVIGMSSFAATVTILAKYGVTIG